MKFADNRLDFIKALEPAVKVASGKQMAILGNVLLTAEAGEIKLRGYNLAVAVFSSVTAAIDEQGSILIDGQVVSAFLQKCAETTAIIATEDKKISVKCGKTKTSLRYSAADDYPKIAPVTDSAAQIALKTSELFGAVKIVSYAAADICPRKSLECINISIDKRGIKLISCDGYRAAAYAREVNSGVSCNTSFGVFKNDIKTVMSIISSDEVTLKYNDKELEFDSEGVAVRVNLLAEQYPEIEKRIAENVNAAVQHITLDSARLKEVLSKIMALPHPTGDIPLRIDLSADKMSFLYDFGRGVFTDEIECELEGAPFTVGVKTSYLSDMLKASRGSITLNCNGSGGALTVLQGDMRQMLMPMRLKK